MDVNMESMTNKNDSKKSNTMFKVFTQEGLIPVTLKMLNQCVETQSKQIDGVDFTKVILIARVDAIDVKSNKYIVDINDSTAVAKVIKGNSEDSDILQPHCYFQFILSVREDKEEFVLYCEKIKKINEIEELTYHMLRVIAASIERRNSKSRQ